MIEEKILCFIEKFRNVGNNPEVIISNFTSGNCYWFALILYERFVHNVLYSEIEIMYNQIDGHFACRIKDNIYDITGKIDSKEYNNYGSWMQLQYTDPSLWRRVYFDCVIQTEGINNVKM